ncbi:MAG: acetolactate synthase 2 catalytic subunit [Gammaproteobacteria bacterium]|nr:acetolactate synthase 2 catalytic subunit [Gammaproteobacteria bacterium]
MRAADFIIQALINEGVDCLFGYPGGAIMPVYDALVGAPLKHVLCRHEQGAALAADGYARASGRVGVCLATSGPGATNLVTGIANAYMDSVPVVAITGQVAKPLIGTDAFQEVDVFGITLPVVKHSFLVRKAEDLPRVFAEAFRIAREGRPGPVLIDIPKDVQLAEFSPTPFLTPVEVCEPLPELDIERARAMIASARQPLICAGGGVVIAQAVAEFRVLAEATGIPVVSTLKGLGCLPAEHPQHLGMLGMHGTRAANYAVQSCDLLLVIGARFDDRATGKLAEFAPHARVIHLDADRAEIGKLRAVEIGISAPLKRVLPRLGMALDIAAWREKCAADKREHGFRYDAPMPGIYAPHFLQELSARAAKQTVIACDVGQHQMWVAQHYGFDHPSRHLTSGGLGTMGYGLPAAIGAQFAEPNTPVILVSGDGSFMMNVQELGTIRRYGLPIKIVLFDNQMLGMVKQWQELFFSERYSEVDLSDNPDFCQMASAFEIPARSIALRAEQAEAIAELLAAPGPMLLHVRIDPKANVWPLVPPGANNATMMEGVES